MRVSILGLVAGLMLASLPAQADGRVSASRGGAAKTVAISTERGVRVWRPIIADDLEEAPAAVQSVPITAGGGVVIGPDVYGFSGYGHGPGRYRRGGHERAGVVLNGAPPVARRSVTINVQVPGGAAFGGVGGGRFASRLASAHGSHAGIRGHGFVHGRGFAPGYGGYGGVGGHGGGHR